MVKVSADEASKTVREGARARRDYLDHLVQSAGGTIEGMWLTNVGDWDLILLLDMKEGSTAEGAAATLARRAAGMTVAERWIELVDVDAAEEALAALRGVHPH
jgi:hypothetical protein